MLKNIKTMPNLIDNKLKKRFRSGFRCNIFGSLSYEILRITHQVLFLKTLSRTEYGLMGGLFSLVYLTIYFSDFSNSSSLPPFLQTFTQSKHNFKKLLPLYLLPQILLQSIAAIIATIFYTNGILNHHKSPFLFILPALIIMEGLRIFFRSLLHYMFKSKKVMVIELTISVCYYATIWAVFFATGKMTLNTIFVPYLLDTVIALLLFLRLTHKEYKQLPRTATQIPEGIHKRMFKARCYNFVTQISKNFFTGNFLVTIFASQFGLQTAGILKLASNIADAAKALIKVTIGFSGNALLSQLKNKSLRVKLEAFQFLSNNLNNLIYFILIFITINYSRLINLKVDIHTVSQNTFLFSFMFLFIATAEYFFIVYEQFYILEEKAFKLMVFKLLEFALFYIFVITRQASQPIYILITVLIIQVIGFVIIATSAYREWKIKPQFKISSANLTTYTAISICFYLLLSISQQ